MVARLNAGVSRELLIQFAFILDLDTEMVEPGFAAASRDCEINRRRARP